MVKERVCVVGEGAWGTAIATLLAHNGYTVNLWCYHAEIAEEIRMHRTNIRYMPGVMLSPLIHATYDMAEALTGVQWVFEAIPVQYLRSVLVSLVPHLQGVSTIVALSKGIEQDSLLLPTQIMDEVFSQSIHTAVIAGPSFARDVVRQQPTGFVIASQEPAIAKQLQMIMHSSFSFPELSRDMLGVQLCSALKNVITLGVGILHGAGYTDNTKALFITRCLHEMSLLVTASGGLQETVYGLAGVGDLILTAYGSLSRNGEVGRRLGAGETLASIIAATGYTPEGVNSAISLYKLAERVGVNMPLCCSIYDILYNGRDVHEIIRAIRN
jgi:glycerol-3-phosphate dehydrogenase (NAD(P)+)